MSSRKEENKNFGRIYTPKHIVSLILDYVGYSSSDTDLTKTKIIDPSCGDGAFLVECVYRLCSFCKILLDKKEIELKDIKRFVIDNVHGIEIDPLEALKARENIVEIFTNFFPNGDLRESELKNIVSRDALDILFDSETRALYSHSFNFVVGNPPYVRIHNLKDTSRLPSWCGTGMTDLYYGFFELGDALCDKNSGKLCYIAPSSWFTNRSAKNMREALKEKKNITGIIDLEHAQVFSDAQTYTAIVKMESGSSPSHVEYITVKDLMSDTDTEEREKDETISSLEDKTKREISLDDKTKRHKLDVEDIWMSGFFVPIISDRTKDIKEILEEKNVRNDSIHVKNGLNSNWNRFYFRDIFYEGEAPGKYIIETIKASTKEKGQAFFPYSRDSFGNILLADLEEFKDFPIYEELLAEKERLLMRTQINDKTWHMYARSQGIADVFVDKVAVNLMYRGKDDIKIKDARSGVGVYGGVYVLGSDAKKLLQAMSDPLFMEYARAIRRYKSGGYFELRGKDLEKYLKWYDFSQS